MDRSPRHRGLSSSEVWVYEVGTSLDCVFIGILTLFLSVFEIEGCKFPSLHSTNLLVEQVAHEVNLKMESEAPLTLKSLKEAARSLKSHLVGEKRAGGVNFMG